MKKKSAILALLLLSVGAAAAFYAVHYPSRKKIEPGNRSLAAGTISEPKTVVQASVETITEWYEAVGTVRPRTETNIDSQVTAQVKDVRVRPGNSVSKGEVLVHLDNRQFLSRLDQAKQGLNSAVSAKKQAEQSMIAAEAAFRQAESDYRRIQTYYDSQAATSRDLEKAKADYLQAEAGLKRAGEALRGADALIRQAEEVVKEADIAMGYTKITAPEEGEVLRRLVEPGDLAVPGKPLIILQTQGALRLEVYVREGLIRKAVPGTALQASIQTLGVTATVKVEEVVPYADPQTRTFLVKAALPPITGLYPGMFGRLLIPVREQAVVVVPRKAIRRVGQLELVTVKENGAWTSRFVTTGRSIDETRVEVLSGLNGNETIALIEG